MAGANGRIAFFDFLKGIAIISVIFLHCADFTQEGAWVKEPLSFGVELFVIASGFLLAKRYENGVAVLGYWKGIFIRLVPAYVFFTLALHLFACGFLISPHELLLDVLLGRQNGGSLYFIPVILQLYLVFPILNRYRRKALSPPFLALALALSLLISQWDSMVRVPWNADPFALAFCGRYFFLFVLGMWMSERKIEDVGVKKSAAILVCLLALVLLSFAISLPFRQVFLYPAAMFFAIRAAYLALEKAKPAASILSAVESTGRMSLMVYILHPIAIYGVLARLPFEPAGWAGYLAYSLAALALSYAGAAMFYLAGRLVWKGTARA